MDSTTSLSFLDVDLPSATSDPQDLHTLLSNTEFFFLVLFSAACYYTALMISAVAVGESVSAFISPFVMLRSLFTRGFTALRTLLRGRRQHVFIGVENDDDGAGVGGFGVMNEPTRGVFQ